MTRYIACLIVMLFALSSFACSGSKANKTDLSPSQDSLNSDSSADSGTEKLSDFTDSIYEDIETLFKESSMNLVSLQKNAKGTLIKAEIKESNAEMYVPQAIELLHENFKRLEELIVVSSGNATAYSIKIETVEKLAESKSGNELLTALWNKVEISGEKVVVEEKTGETSTPAAGV